MISANDFEVFSNDFVLDTVASFHKRMISKRSPDCPQHRPPCLTPSPACPPSAATAAAAGFDCPRVNLQGYDHQAARPPSAATAAAAGFDWLRSPNQGYDHRVHPSMPVNEFFHQVCHSTRCDQEASAALLACSAATAAIWSQLGSLHAPDPI